MNPRWILIALVLLHMLLAGWHAAVTPYRTSGIVWHQPSIDIGAPDELQHVNYVDGLLKNKKLPIFSPSDPKLGENYESHQPPAYYLMAAAWSKLVGINDLTSQEGIRLRWLNILFGALTIIGVYSIGKWGFQSESLGLVASAFTALLPMYVALCGAASNDPLLILCCTWTLALLALAMQSGWTLRRALGIALICALGFYTKTTAIILIPTIFASLFVSKAPKKIWPIALLLPLLLALPWWMRNQSLYGDPFALTAFNKAFVNSPKAHDFIAQIGFFGYWKQVAWFTSNSFFGVFGYMNLFMPEKLVRLLLAGTLLLILGWLLSWGREDWKPHLKLRIVQGVLALLTLLLYIQFNRTYFQAQARYLFPALAPISIGLAIGWLTLTKNRWIPGVMAVSLILIGVNLYVLNVVLPNGFHR